MTKPKDATPDDELAEDDAAPEYHPDTKLDDTGQPIEPEEPAEDEWGRSPLGSTV